MTATAARLREQASLPLKAARRQPETGAGGVPDSTAADPARGTAGELLRGFARTGLWAAPYQLVLLVVLSALAAAWVPLAAVAPGAAAVAATLLAESVRCRALLRARPEAIAPRRWRLGFALGGLAQGLGWALFAWPLLELAPDAGAGVDTFVLVLLLLVAGAAAVLRAPVPSAVVGVLAPLTLVVAATVSRSEGPGYGVLAFVVLSGQIFVAWVAHGLHRAAATTVQARAKIHESFAELEEMTARTAEAYRRAEEADRAKTQFFATMSHELRTPLNAILGFSEVMKNEVLGSHSTPSYREYSSDIYGSGQYLLALINGILDLSRIASGEYVLQEEKADLGALARASVEALAPAAAVKSQEVVMSVAPDLEPILVDTAAVRQIVDNLVSNAIKFSAPGSRIEVRVGWTSRGGQYVGVSDEGPGIPADEIPLVLSSFGRGSLAVSTAEPGVGLGLPVARGLAELHGGRLLLDSTLRQGTRATVVFPAARCEAVRTGAEPEVRRASAA